MSIDGSLRATDCLFEKGCEMVLSCPQLRGYPFVHLLIGTTVIGLTINPENTDPETSSDVARFVVALGLTLTRRTECG